MRVKTFKVKCSALKPGDLFSTMGQEYWDCIDDVNIKGGSLGERVYIRTSVTCPLEEKNESIFLIKILRKAK